MRVEEVMTGIGIALGQRPLDNCPAFDASHDRHVTIDELVAAVRAALEGCPAPNHPPVVRAMSVYRTHPGYSIALSVLAEDPDGDRLGFVARDLPTGATFDSATGRLAWTPAPDQVGAYQIAVEVGDNGDPPASVSTTLPLKVSPLDACTMPACTPATGCRDDLHPLPQACCSTEPDLRIPEPDAACPGGLVLFGGRNTRGFGRLQNCDRLRVATFAQGGASVQFHVESRCVTASGLATVSARLETAEALVFDRTERVELLVREDGYAQALALVYSVRAEIPPETLEGREAVLTLRLVDASGTDVWQSLRVVLTLSELGDLPEPDIEDVPAGEAGCVGCHRPLGPGGQRQGIEDAHPWSALACTDCHGGNAGASTRSAAHVSAGGGPTFLKNLTSDELDRLPAAYLRFVNPGDLRVAAETCGRSGCHPGLVRNVPLSTMSTYAAHYTLPRYLAGMQSRDAQLAAVDVTDLDFDPPTAPPGAVESMRALRGPAPGADRAALATAIDEYLPKACPTCHLNSFGPNNSAGNYRSSGCTACHMVYANDGLSRSADPVIGKDFPAHPVTHQLTTAIPTEQCAHCHFQGGRIGLAYRGIREGGFAPAKTPLKAVPLGVPLHAHDGNYYFTDEDATNTIDETPPDLHFSAGLVCADCHVGGDVHGDGNLYRSERNQVGIRCEDCHGTVRAEPREDPADGLFKNAGGFPLRRLRRTEDDRIVLRLIANDRDVEVPPIHRILQSGRNLLMNEAMGVDESGFSHTDSLECYTCHTSWRLTCFGCHVTVNDTGSAKNLTTGERTAGQIGVVRDTYSIDFFALGRNERGKISPLCNSMSMFFSYVDATGTMRYRDQVRTSSDGKIGFGWNPFHHHTVSRQPQSCDRCHPTALGSNAMTLAETYGFGNGLFPARDGEGRLYDLSAFLDAEGNLTSDFPHPDTGPIPADVRARALSVVVEPQPR